MGGKKAGLKKGQEKPKPKPDSHLPNPSIDPAKGISDSTRSNGNSTKLSRNSELSKIPQRRSMPANGHMKGYSQNAVFAVHQRRKNVADYYLKGWTQWEISQEIGCNIDTVTADLQVIQKMWFDRSADAFEQRRCLELAKLDFLERKAQEAFDRSCGIEEVHTETDRTSDMGSTIEKRVQRKKLIGDPRFLQQIERCIELRCKIFGFMKDDKGQQVNVFNINWQEVASATSGAEDIERIIKSAGVEQVEREEESDGDG